MAEYYVPNPGVREGYGDPYDPYSGGPGPFVPNDEREAEIQAKVDAEMDRLRAQIEAERARIEIARGTAEANEWYQRAQIALQKKQLALERDQFAASLGGPSNYFQYSDYLAGSRAPGSQRGDIASLTGSRPRAAFNAPADPRAMPPPQSIDTINRQQERGRPVGARYNAAGERIRYGGGGGGGGNRLMAAPAVTGGGYLPNAAALAAASPYNVYQTPSVVVEPEPSPVAVPGGGGGYGGGGGRPGRGGGRGEGMGGGGARWGGGGEGPNTGGGDEGYRGGGGGGDRTRMAWEGYGGGNAGGGQGGDSGRGRAAAVKDPRKAALEAAVKAYQPSGTRGYTTEDAVFLDTVDAIAAQGADLNGDGRISERERRQYRRDMPPGGYTGQQGLGGLGKGLGAEEKDYLRQVRDSVRAGPHTFGNQSLESMTETERGLWASALRKLGHNPEDILERYARSRIGNQGAAVGLA